MPSFAQNMIAVHSLAPATDAAGRTGKYASLVGASKAVIKVLVKQGDANTVLLEPKQAQDASGTNVKALANAVPIWVNSDTANGNTLTKQTDAVNYTTTNAVTSKMVVFDVPPLALDTANGFTHLTIATGASNVGNLTAATIEVASGYKGVTLS